MKNLLVACTLVIAAIFVVGFVKGESTDPMKLSAIVEKRLITVVVTMPKIDQRYRWLSVHGCSAEVVEHGSFCTGDWEMESTRQLSGVKQELFPWRDVPPGTMRIDAIAFDNQQRQVALSRLTVFRGE